VWQTLKQEFEHKRFVWELVEEMERPRVVNARVATFDSKDSLLAQVVVRMHTKQILALYNSVGTLTKGHPTRPRDVIDYVVFERLLAKPQSRWRIATKLPPQLPWRTGDNNREQNLLLFRHFSLYHVTLFQHVCHTVSVLIFYSTSGLGLVSRQQGLEMRLQVTGFESLLVCHVLAV